MVDKNPVAVKKTFDKSKLAKTIVMLDSAIGSSGGLADFLGRMIANFFGVFSGAELKDSSVDSSDVAESNEG